MYEQSRLWTNGAITAVVFVAVGCTNIYRRIKNLILSTNFIWHWNAASLCPSPGEDRLHSSRSIYYYYFYVHSTKSLSIVTKLLLLRLSLLELCTPLPWKLCLPCSFFPKKSLPITAWKVIQCSALRDRMTRNISPKVFWHLNRVMIISVWIWHIPFWVHTYYVDCVKPSQSSFPSHLPPKNVIPEFSDMTIDWYATDFLSIVCQSV